MARLHKLCLQLGKPGLRLLGLDTCVFQISCLLHCSSTLVFFECNAFGVLRVGRCSKAEPSHPGNSQRLHWASRGRAGVAGLMEALNLGSHASVPPALHLRTMNPHVAAVLHSRAVGNARGGPAPVGHVSGAGLLVTGVSSFGAQVTNAHALVSGTANIRKRVTGRHAVLL